MVRRWLSDAQWREMKSLLPPERGRRGRPAKDNRLMVEGMLWVLRTGAPWRDLPDEFGPWNSVYTRFRRWSARGVWQTAFERVKQGWDQETNGMDSTVVRAHQHAAGAKGGLTARR